jgi:hypothetical protein
LPAAVVFQFSSATPKQAGAYVAHDSGQPTHKSFGVPQCPQVPKGPDKTLLGGVLAQFSVAQVTPGNGIDHALVALNKFRETVSIALFNGFYCIRIWIHHQASPQQSTPNDSPLGKRLRAQMRKT